MSYSAEINRRAPALLVFLLDHSTSMAMQLADGPSKASFLADVINKTIFTLITTCTKADGVRDYFHVSVISYSGNGARNELHGNGDGQGAIPISYLASNPLRVEIRDRRVAEQDGESQTIKVKFPIWIEPKSRGKTAMCSGLNLAREEISLWCAKRPNCYPPTLLHVTDGHPTDGDPEPIAREIKNCSTEDGQTLVLNLHIDIGNEASVLFPRDEVGLKDKYAKKLFRMSSELPHALIGRATTMGYKVGPGARGFAYNATLQPIVDFFELGTRPATLSNR